MEVSNNVLTVFVILAMAVSLVGTMSILSVLPGQPGVITGMQTTTGAGIANATLESVVHIRLVPPWDVVEFGSIYPGVVNDTTDFDPHPFVIENNGSEVINVSIAESTAGGSGKLWTNDLSCQNCFQFNSTPNGTTGAVQYASWTNFEGSAESADAASISTDPANLIYNLTAVDSGGDEIKAYVHLNITPPTGEPTGVKEATIYFRANQG